MIYSPPSFKRKIRLVSLVILSSISFSTHGFAMNDEKKIVIAPSMRKQPILIKTSELSQPIEPKIDPIYSFYRSRNKLLEERDTSRKKQKLLMDRTLLEEGDIPWKKRNLPLDHNGNSYPHPYSPAWKKQKLLMDNNGPMGNNENSYPHLYPPTFNQQSVPVQNQTTFPFQHYPPQQNNVYGSDQVHFQTYPKPKPNHKMNQVAVSLHPSGASTPGYYP